MARIRIKAGSKKPEKRDQRRAAFNRICERYERRPDDEQRDHGGNHGILGELDVDFLSIDDPMDEPDALFDAALADSPVPLAHREALIRRLGELPPVIAHAGPRTRKALDHLDAEAAARGRHVFFRQENPPLETVAHEVAHVLQAEQGPAGGEGVVSQHVDAEMEANFLSKLVAHTAHRPAEQAPFLPPQNSVAGRMIALLRDGAAPTETPPPQHVRTPAHQTDQGASTPAPQSQNASPAERVDHSRRTASPAQPAQQPERTPASEPTTASKGKEASKTSKTKKASKASKAKLEAHHKAQQEAAAALDEASSSDALMQAMAKAPPSVKAEHYATLNRRAQTLAQSEQADFF